MTEIAFAAIAGGFATGLSLTAALRSRDSLPVDLGQLALALLFVAGPVWYTYGLRAGLTALLGLGIPAVLGLLEGRRLRRTLLR